MEQWNQLWEYQQKDMALDQFKAALKDTPTRKRLVKLQRYLKNSQKKVNNMEARALQMQGEMQSIEKQYAGLEAELEELEKDISYYSECDDDELDTEQAKTLIKQATAVVNKSGKLKEDLQSMHDEVEQADKTVRELLQKMLSAKKEYDMLKVEHQKELDSGSGEQQALENAVKEAAQNISPEILAEYSRIKGFRPNPVAILENSRCNGCNMQLPAGVSGRILKGDGIVTCENCGRILIVL